MKYYALSRTHSQVTYLRCHTKLGKLMHFCRSYLDIDRKDRLRLSSIRFHSRGDCAWDDTSMEGLIAISFWNSDKVLYGRWERRPDLVDYSHDLIADLRVHVRP